MLHLTVSLRVRICCATGSNSFKKKSFNYNIQRINPFMDERASQSKNWKQPVDTLSSGLSRTRHNQMKTRGIRQWLSKYRLRVGNGNGTLEWSCHCSDTKRGHAEITAYFCAGLSCSQFSYFIKIRGYFSRSDKINHTWFLDDIECYAVVLDQL